MLLSMTGFGEARRQVEDWTIGVDIRSVNNRHLKLTCKVSEPLATFEPEVERRIREQVRRGTVQVVIRLERPPSSDQYRLNLVALESYRAQLLAFLGDEERPPDFFSALLDLPGVVEFSARDQEKADGQEYQEVLIAVLLEALQKFQDSRSIEGRSMQEELISMGRRIAAHLDRVEARGPLVVSGYRDRLQERVQSLVQERGVTVQASDLIREVAIFAERGDIAEEVTRLKAHLEQYAKILESRAEDAAGRKLEFIVQEMGRETNTIGSKSNDVEISREVVEIKSLLERIRELIQNVE